MPVISLLRPIVSGVVQSINTQNTSVPENVLWDANNKSTEAILSNGDLTMLTTDYFTYSDVKSTYRFSSGCKAVRQVVTRPIANFISAGVATVDWDAIGGEHYNAPGQYFGLACSGATVYDFVNRGIPISNGQGIICLVDQVLGYGWFDTDAGTAYSTDAENGVNPHFTFTPGTVLWPAASCWSQDDTTPVGVTLDPGFSRGRFDSLTL